MHCLKHVVMLLYITMNSMNTSREASDEIYCSGQEIVSDGPFSISKTEDIKQDLSCVVTQLQNSMTLLHMILSLIIVTDRPVIKL